MKTFIHRSHHLHELNHVITYLLYFTQGVTIKLPVNWHTVSFTSATVSAQASPLSAVRYLVGFGYGYFHTFRSVSDIWPMATMQGLLRSAQTVPFTPTAFSILVLFQQRLFNRKADVYGSSLLLTAKPWLDTSYFHSLYNTIPVFIDYCRISPMETTFMLSPKTDPHPSNCYCTVRHHTVHPNTYKRFDPARGAFSFANAPAGSYRVEYLYFVFPMYSLP